MSKIEQINVQLLKKQFEKPIGGSGVASVDVIVATVKSEGLQGLGFSYVIGEDGGHVATLAQEQAERFLLGQALKAPAQHWHEIKQSFRRTGDGPNMLALAALDVALWDLTALKANQPLALAMGGKLQPTPVYASGGFLPNAAPQASAELAAAHMAAGYQGVKPRLNANETDEAVLRLVRDAIGPDAPLMADVNEKGNLDTATHVLGLGAEYGLRFIEEPLPSGEILAYRQLAKLPHRAPIATGEHLQGLDRFEVFLEDKLASIIQPDLAMAGGLTPSLAVAQMAEKHQVCLAPHFLPGLFIHLAGTFKGDLLLEDFPIIEDFFEGWPERASDGTLQARNCAGHGLTLVG